MTFFYVSLSELGTDRNFTENSVTPLLDPPRASYLALRPSQLASGPSYLAQRPWDFIFDHSSKLSYFPLKTDWSMDWQTDARIDHLIKMLMMHLVSLVYFLGVPKISSEALFGIVVRISEDGKHLRGPLGGARFPSSPLKVAYFGQKWAKMSQKWENRKILAELMNKLHFWTSSTV